MFDPWDYPEPPVYELDEPYDRELDDEYDPDIFEYAEEDEQDV